MGRSENVCYIHVYTYFKNTVGSVFILKLLVVHIGCRVYISPTSGVSDNPLIIYI